MKRIKKFQDWLVENGNPQMGITSIDNPGGFTYNPLGEDEEESNYMFFANLKRTIELSSMILKMDKSKIDELLNNGHDWANDHITTAKTNVEHVFEFLNDDKSLSESAVSKLNRQYSMNSTWWSAWRLENEDKEKLEITKDMFSKTYEVKKDGKVLLVYDYSKNKIYTNESPETFILKQDVDAKAMTKIQKKVDDIEDDLAGSDPEKDGDEKEAEASGEEETDATEEE
jgi:hypothetical protein